jgi:hypothetical protein
MALEKAAIRSVQHVLVQEVVIQQQKLMEVTMLLLLELGV